MYSGAVPGRGELRLAKALLFRTLIDLTNPRHRDEARNWFARDDSELTLVSDVLGLDPEALRRRAEEIAEGTSTRMFERERFHAQLGCRRKRGVDED